MSDKSFRWRYAVPGVVLALVAVTVSGTATASADPLGPSGSAKGAPAAAPAGGLDAGCTLSPSLSSPAEHTSCLGVGATLSALPALGTTATLTVTVRAGRAERATQVTVDLPGVLAFADGTATTTAVTGAGRSARAAIATVDLARGETRTWTRTVRAVAPGAGELRATARSVVTSRRTDAGADVVRLTVGAAGTASKAGTAAPAAAGGDQAVAPTTAAAVPAAVGRPAVALPAAEGSPASAPSKAPGTSCATGSWNFVDAGGVTRGVGKVTVQIRENGTTIASGFAGGGGSYNVCFATGGATRTVAVRFVLNNRVYRVVTNAGNDFAWVTPAAAVADNSTRDFGSLQPADSLGFRPNHAFLSASTMYDWIYQNAPGRDPGVGCWSPYASSCFPLVVHWDNNNPAPSVFSHDTAEVTLAGDAPDSEDRPVHEYGHALMWGLYGNTIPATTNCSPHALFGASSTTCAWVEGWGDWVDTSVWNNTIYTGIGGSTTDFNTTWGDGQDTGDQVEGRVVQALDSINDGVKYPYDNIAGGGYHRAADYFTVLRTYRPSTFGGFWGGRAAAGQDVSQASLSALYQGTIDYGFRNPLVDGVAKSLPRALPHNYGFATTKSYWSAVAVRPADGNDSDLVLFTDAGQTAALGSSGYSGTVTDFVAINSNSGARALQTYYPRVSAFSGSGGYTVLGVQGNSTFSSGVRTATTSASRPIEIVDSYQTADTPVYFRAVPANGQSLALTFLPPGGTIVSRSAGLSSATGAPGAPVGLTANPSASGYGGLVLTNQGLGSGSVTLYADTTAPTATSVVINNGAPRSVKPNIYLTTAATDDQTGVASMQVSTDGTFDSEPVLPYAATATARLSGPNGLKTVWVRYLDNAGIWSAPVTDTIKLQVAPTIGALSPTSGPAAGGTSVTIRGTFLTGASVVKFGGVRATSWTVVSDNVIRAVSPAGAGVQSVTVTTPTGTVVSAGAARFTYVAAPTVTSLSPSSGPAGTQVVVTGTGFTGASTVSFGSRAGTNVTVVSATKLRVRAPAGSGAVYVRVTSTGGVSAAVAGSRYLYLT